MGKLTPKQERFVQEFLVDLNGTQAAIRAGYSARTANEQAARLLAKASVQEAVDAEKKKRDQRVHLTQDYILGNLIQVVERCMQRAPVMVFAGPKEGFIQATDEAGNHLWQFDARGANKALELLGKHKKLFTDKLELTGKLTLEQLVEASTKSGE